MSREPINVCKHFFISYFFEWIRSYSKNYVNGLVNIFTKTRIHKARINVQKVILKLFDNQNLFCPKAHNFFNDFSVHLSKPRLWASGRLISNSVFKLQTTIV